tara:strand:- start:2773 stop:3069 length:297 start_codon:yes stop_codon:yes gene_type:complete
MGEVRVKTGKPQPTEFSRDDVVIDSTTGDIYFKDREGRLKSIKNTFDNVPNTQFGAPTEEVLGDLLVTGSIESTETGSFSGPISGSNLGNTPIDGGSF